MKEVNRDLLLNASLDEIEVTIDKYTDKIYIRTETDGNSNDTENIPTNVQKTIITICIKSVISAIRYGHKTTTEIRAIMNCAEFTTIHFFEDEDETPHINTYLSFCIPCINVLREYGIEI